MVYMPLLWPALVLDIKKLEADLTYDYWIGANVIFISLINEEGEERTVSDEE